MKNQIAIIGTGVMGKALAKNFIDKNIKIATYDKVKTEEQINQFDTLKECINSLESPKKILLMLPAGNIIDQTIENLIPLLNENDIIMDAGNSYFQDTNKRQKYLEEKKINYFGVGISGGEKGALEGPSIMPGGNKKAYEQIKPYLEAIAAKKDKTPCCTYIGKQGSGHFVKMVHNGIEYADMQLISEIYIFLKQVKKLTNSQISRFFNKLNQTESKSYLIHITEKILLEKDHLTENDLIDMIKDEASNKSTGAWTSKESFELSINISTITSALQARIISNNKLKINLKQPEEKVEITEEEITKAYYLAKIIAYAQGFDMIKTASNKYNWNLNLENIAKIFQEGCIIKAKLLESISNIYQKDIHNIIEDENINQIIINNINDLRKLTIISLKNALPIPTMTSALTYIDQLNSNLLGANMIQAQRDYFGAHTYMRKDKEGTFHNDWN